jgi:hypothetical protein
MKAFLFALFIACSCITAFAQNDPAKELEERVHRQEERMAKLEYSATAYQQPVPAKKMMIIARQHAMQEQSKFKAEDIARAEELYQKGAQIFQYDASKPLLDSVVSIYPQLNRAGCAQLYRAQQEAGKEKERLLKDCMARFSMCYYFDGAQVGPLAMMQLAFYYKQAGSEHDADNLLGRLRKENPEAVGHDGALLVSKI